MAATRKEYQFWNGKNIDGKSYAGDPNLIKVNNPEYVVGVDTFAADDLQPGIDYDI